MRNMKGIFRSFVGSLRPRKKTILLIAITAVATLIVSSLISMWLLENSDIRIPSFGTLRFEDVEGYWDENLTNKTGSVASCNWGLMWPGATKNITLYLRSMSNTETRFDHAETDWALYNSSNKVVPGLSNITQYMWLSWDYANSTVRPGQTVRVTMTLHVSSDSALIDFLIGNDVKGFSFDIHIGTSEES